MPSDLIIRIGLTLVGVSAVTSAGSSLQFLYSAFLG